MIYRSLLSCGHSKTGATPRKENDVLVCFHCSRLGMLRRVLEVKQVEKPRVEVGGTK